jgi:surfactin synthase thioesterase subunit
MMEKLELNRTLRVLETSDDPCARIVCLPYAGGAASLFRAWPAGLPRNVELRAVQLPARQDRHMDPAFTRVDAIVDHLAALMRELRPLPTLLFGHSFGALVAFELARRLEAGGIPPFCLIASARRAPHLPLAHPPLHALGDADFLAGMNRYCGTPWNILRNAELMDLTLPALRADFRALETFTYTASAPLDVPTIILRGRQDKSMSTDAALAWSEVVTREIHVHEVDAGHFFVDTHRSWVLERVTDALQAALPALQTGPRRSRAS